MRKLLGVGAIVLGIVGVLLSATAVGVAWWAALQTTARLNSVAARLDRGMSDADEWLARIDTRLNAVRPDLNAVVTGVEAIAAENLELPGVRAKVGQLLDRLAPAFSRADALAESLRSVAAGLRTAADLVDQINDAPAGTVRARAAADGIDRAAESLNGLRARGEALRSAPADQLTRELAHLAREAAAGSEQLAGGLAAARREITVVRGGTTEWRDWFVSWTYVVATTSTLLLLWGGLGQLCLIGWGRRRFEDRATRADVAG